MGENILIKKTEGSFHFFSKYEDNGDTERRETGVLLTINYQARTYDILTLNKSNEFKFLNQHTGQNKIKAIAECISKAIDFANEQLKLHEFSESNQPSN